MRALDGNRGLDSRPRVVSFEGEVFVAESENILHVGLDPHGGQGAGRTGQLCLDLLQEVQVDVGVAERVDEFAGLEPYHLCHHHGEQGVGGDVEGYAEEQVGRPLVELAAELAVGHVELEQGMARRQSHVRDVGHVPCADDVAAAVGVVLQRIDQLADLVDVTAVGRGPAAPLVAVDVAQVAGHGVGPFVPDGHAVVVQVFDVGVAAQEPKQLVDDRPQVEFLGGQAREAGAQIESHLVAEDADGAGAGAVAATGAVVADVAKQVKVLLHGGTGFVLSVVGGVGCGRCSKVSGCVWARGLVYSSAFVSLLFPGVCPVRSVRASGCGVRGRLAGFGQREREGGADVGGAADGDGLLVGLEDVFHDR